MLGRATKIRHRAEIFGHPVRDSESFGVVEVGKHFMAVFIDEKPLHSKSNWVVMGSISMIVTSYSLRRSKMSGSSYAPVITSSTHIAPSIKVAEAAKVIENSQRDINIEFVNELAKILN